MSTQIIKILYRTDRETGEKLRIGKYIFDTSPKATKEPTYPPSSAIESGRAIFREMCKGMEYCE